MITTLVYFEFYILVVLYNNFIGNLGINFKIQSQIFQSPQIMNELNILLILVKSLNGDEFRI